MGSKVWLTISFSTMTSMNELPLFTWVLTGIILLTVLNKSVYHVKNAEPVIVTRCLIISSMQSHLDCRHTWSSCGPGAVSCTIDVESFKRLVILLNTLCVFPGNKFVKIKKGKLLTIKEETTAYLDTKCSVTYARSTYSRIVRHVGCELLVTGT